MSDSIFYREVIQREFSPYGGESIPTYYKYIEFVYTDDIEPFNKRKKKKFEIISNEDFKKRFGPLLNINKLYNTPSQVKKIKIGIVCAERRF